MDIVLVFVTTTINSQCTEITTRQQRSLSDTICIVKHLHIAPPPTDINAVSGLSDIIIDNLSYTFNDEFSVFSIDQLIDLAMKMGVSGIT